MNQPTFPLSLRNVDQNFKEERQKQWTSQKLQGISMKRNQIQNPNINPHLLKKSTTKRNSKCCGSASHCETLSVAVASLSHQITLSQPPIAFTCSISLFAVFPLRTSPFW